MYDAIYYNSNLISIIIVILEQQRFAVSPFQFMIATFRHCILNKAVMS